MENELNRHLTDQEFFVFLKFRDCFLSENSKKEPFNLKDLDLGYDIDFDLFNKLMTVYDAWLSKILVGIEKPYDFDSIIKKLHTEAESDTNYDVNVYKEVIAKIENQEKITLNEVGIISWIWVEVYRHVEFSPADYKLTKKQKVEITQKIDSYLEMLRNDQLSIYKQNFYRFDIQKKMLIDLIEENDMITKYGNSFILREKVNQNMLYFKDHSFAPIQTAYALEDLGYLKVQNVWSTQRHKSTSRFNNNDVEIYFLHLNIEITDLFLSELNQEYRKKNPDNKIASFNKESGILKLANEEIFLMKGTKKTDATRLVETLLTMDKNEYEDGWMEKSEILSDWGYNLEDQEGVAKNKVYQAKLAVNNAVEKATQINDFILGGTIRFRINPRYIDEDVW